jgi:hypothetical protein
MTRGNGAEAPPKFDSPPLDTSGVALASASGPDPFDDIDALRVAPDYASLGATKRVITTIPVRRPGKQSWIRVHDKLSFATVLLWSEGDREWYLVGASARAYLEDEAQPWALYLCITAHGAIFFWPVRLPGADGRSNDWWDSAHEAARIGQQSWVRVKASTDQNAYVAYTPLGRLNEPTWPDAAELGLPTLLRKAFRQRVVDAYDHPLLKTLRGETA